MADGIVVRDLNAWFGNAHVLHGIGVTIAPKAVTAVIGPSGCGKSTFIRCLNRMHEVVPGARVTGSVRVATVYSVGLHELPAYLKEYLRSYPDVNVHVEYSRPNKIYENVIAGMRLNNKRLSKSDADGIVEKSLKGANLWNEVKDRLSLPGQGLSGGQQQRLCIARAIAVSPDVLLMDEPCSALDPISTSKVEDLMEQLSASVTIVIVTHNMQQAARVSDKTAFLLLGRVVEHGSTEDIFTRPSKKETEDYITGRFG